METSLTTSLVQFTQTSRQPPEQLFSRHSQLGLRFTAQFYSNLKNFLDEAKVDQVWLQRSAPGCGAGNGVVVSATRWWCNGTLGRNTLVGPGYMNVDFGVHKKFKVTEGSSLQLQANAFNVFNRANFGLPVGNLNSPQAGRSTTTIGTPRVIQLAIRFDF